MGEIAVDGTDGDLQPVGDLRHRHAGVPESDSVLGTPGSLWLAMAVGLAALPVLPAVLLSTDAPRFETGFSLAAVSYAFWEPMVALGAIAALLH